jgi:hypothetical protein
LILKEQLSSAGKWYADQFTQNDSLPPTCDASRYHSYRFYHQVQTWLGNLLYPLLWGWTLSQSQNSFRLKPIRLMMEPAPASLLKLVKCNCQGKCEKNSCSCRKNGLLCSLACGQCKGITCTNISYSSDEIVNEY